MKNNVRSYPPIFWPLAIAVVLTVIAWVTPIDTFICELFYDAKTNSFPYRKSPFQVFFYNVSPVPAILVFLGGVFVAFVSIWKKSWRRWTRKAIYWSLVMALGPGLVVNLIFKDWYGRPRPIHIYRDQMEFHPVWVPGIPGKVKSFPCGHASIGFYFMAGYFHWWRSNRARARRWLAGGLAAGAVIGFSRVAAAAHWFSDVVWAAVFIYFISYLTAIACGLLKQKEDGCGIT